MWRGGAVIALPNKLACAGKVEPGEYAFRQLFKGSGKELHAK